jgi:hypothetical protein
MSPLRGCAREAAWHEAEEEFAWGAGGESASAAAADDVLRGDDNNNTWDDDSDDDQAEKGGLHVANYPEQEGDEDGGPMDESGDADGGAKRTCDDDDEPELRKSKLTTADKKQLTSERQAANKKREREYLAFVQQHIQGVKGGKPQVHVVLDCEKSNSTLLSLAFIALAIKFVKRASTCRALRGLEDRAVYGGLASPVQVQL